MALTKKEIATLVRLLKKMKWPLPSEVFHALMGKTVSVPLELCIFDEQDHILLFERLDREFNAVLGPGTVLRDNDNDPNLDRAIKRLLAGELRGYRMTYPKNIGWVHVPRGKGHKKNATRHEISLVFFSRLVAGPIHGKAGLYPLDALPKRIIGYHRVMIKKVAQYLKDGKPILG